MERGKGLECQRLKVARIPKNLEKCQNVERAKHQRAKHQRLQKNAKYTESIISVKSVKQKS